jgi:hypothetical protein
MERWMVDNAPQHTWQGPPNDPDGPDTFREMWRFFNQGFSGCKESRYPEYSPLTLKETIETNTGLDLDNLV